MSGIGLHARSLRDLGIANVISVAAYRLLLKAGLHPAQHVRGALAIGSFFRPVRKTRRLPVAATWRDEGRLFGRFPISVGDTPPDWLSNPLTGAKWPGIDLQWWKIPDFDPSAGDIKQIWELSRFDWVTSFAQMAAIGEWTQLERLNLWLSDWARANPPFRGPNWKCGQEAAIRVLHLAIAALLLDQFKDPLPALAGLIETHLQRIAPTLAYARAQNNNHGTSEAAALYVGGLLLGPSGSNYVRRGRAALEERVERLVAKTGGFSQYSINYHRLMLDTLSVVELVRRASADAPFSRAYLEKAKAAALWLFAMLAPNGGDAPNAGANDGARLLDISGAAFRDFRPHINLGLTLFAEMGLDEDTDWILKWLDVEKSERQAYHEERFVDDCCGFATLRQGAAMAMLRFPRFRFRPSQADALHVDLWVGSENLLRDAGTYSYNAGVERLDYYGGVRGHNTIQFDERDQMPRLSRFLFADWIKTEMIALDGPENRIGAAYRDAGGARHQRSVELAPTSLVVRDEILDFQRSAVLRWRLQPGDWRLDGTTARCAGHRLSVKADAAIERCEIVTGKESRHYLEETDLPVLEIEVRKPCSLVSRYDWTI